MNLKSDLTKLVAEQLNLESDEKSLRSLIAQWWQNPRKKHRGGLRLTKNGFLSLTQAGILYHKIILDSPVSSTNKMVIWLDNFMDCPWYLSNQHIYVFGDKMAVQLVLFSGNLDKFIQAKARSQKVVDNA